MLGVVYAECSTFRFQQTGAESSNTKPTATCSSCLSACKGVAFTNVMHTFYFDIPESEKSLFTLKNTVMSDLQSLLLYRKSCNINWLSNL